MDTSIIFSPEAVAVISLFALAWFLVGILVGNNLPRRRGSGASPQRRGHGGDREHGRDRDRHRDRDRDHAGDRAGDRDGDRDRDRDGDRDRDHEGDRAGGDGEIELYVGNLSYDVDDKDLLTAFESYGKVVSGRIIQNRFNGKSKGYGFVEMADRDQALAAIRALNGKEIKGRRIVVNEAKSSPRER